MSRFVRFPLTLLLLASNAEAASLTTREDLLLFGDFRKINQSGVSELSNLEFGELTAVAGITFTLVGENWRFRLKPEGRYLQSPGVGVAQSDPAFQSVEAPERLLPLQWQTRPSDTTQFAGSIELLDISFNTASWELYAGRKPVSMGLLRIFPVWNKFTKLLPVAPGAGLVYSQDVAGARVQLDQVAIQGFQLFSKEYADYVSLGEVAWFSPSIEVHALGAWWWERPVGGLALAKDVGGLSLRAEGLFIGSKDSESTEVQAGGGGEYAFDDRWSALLEFYFQSLGATDVNNYGIRTASRFDPLRAAFYSAAQATFKASQLVTLSAGTIVNCIDGSNYIISRGEYSLSDDASVFASGFFPVGFGGEFTTDAVHVTGGGTVGAPMQISLGLRLSL